MLMRGTMPCWYELSLKGRSGQAGLYLRIHSDFVNQYGEVSTSAPIVENLRSDFGFSEVSGILRGDFGFERSLRYFGTANGFLEHAIPIPRVRKRTGKRCPRCKGTGKRREFNNDKCFACDDGWEVCYDWQEVFAVSATLSLLFILLEFPDRETISVMPQLLTVTTTTSKEAHGGELRGNYSRKLVSYLESRGPGPIPEMITAMRTAWEQVEGEIPSSDGYYFQAYTQGENGQLNIMCPGHGVGICPDINSIGRGRGYRFSSHNVDNPMQQLTLLASLAALHDLARAAGY